MVSASLPTSEVFGQIIRHAENAFKVAERGNIIIITTPFMHCYGDPVLLYLTRNDDEAYILSDRGDTREWLNEFKGFDEGRLLSPIALEFWEIEASLYQVGISQKHHHLFTEANPYDIGPAVFRMIQAITHLTGLGLPDD